MFSYKMLKKILKPYRFMLTNKYYLTDHFNTRICFSCLQSYFVDVCKRSFLIYFKNGKFTLKGRGSFEFSLLLCWVGGSQV